MPAPEPGTGIEGGITLGPTHGGPVRPGVPDSKPFANATFIVESEKGVVTSFATDDQGRFRISLAPGHYASSLLISALQDHVRGKLAPYEYPKEIEFIEALPMTTTGKVQRRVLRLQEEERARAP